MSQPNVRIRVTTTCGKEKDYKELFRRITLDYCKRFKVKVQKGPWDISIIIADYQGDDGATGVTTYLIEDKKIIIQVKEPYDLAMEFPNNEILNHTFLVVLCHEFTHACQALTDRLGIRAKVLMENDEDKDNYADYYFDPEEIEARIMDEYYIRYVPTPLWTAIRAINAKEEA